MSVVISIQLYSYIVIISIHINKQNKQKNTMSAICPLGM